MGNAHGSLDLLCFRAWTAAEVKTIQDVFRRQRPALAVDRSTFETLFDEDTLSVALRVFDKLDVDCDSKVDTFEMLTAVTLWCCASWKEKVGLLFACFDFNCKGGLHFPELALMVATAARVAGCFAASLPPWVSSSSALQDVAAAAFGLTVPTSNANRPGEDRLAEEAFGQWFESSDAAQQLRDFVDASLKHVVPDAADAELREQVRMLDWRVQELAKELLRLREIAATFRSEDEAGGELPAEQQQRLQPLWKRLDGIFDLLDIALETQQRELKELAAAQNRDAAGAMGAAALLAPQARTEHRQLMEAVSGLEHKARSYLDDAQGVLGEIIEVRRAGDHDSRPDSPPTPQTPPTETTQSGRAAAALQRKNRLLDRDGRRRRGRQAVVNSVNKMRGHRNRCFNWRMRCSSNCLMPHHSNSPSQI